MENIHIDFFHGGNLGEDRKALSLLKELSNNAKQFDENIDVLVLGDSESFEPTILFKTLLFIGINEIERFCNFMKFSPDERNAIVLNNFSEGFIGF